MSNFRCGDHGALVEYLYDECDQTTREAVASHLVRCAACASEVTTLGATRARLMDWTPPLAALGFQVADQSGEGLRRTGSRLFGGGGGELEPAPPAAAAWWRKPLPAWAQAVAAVAIFAAGLSVGRARNPATVEPARSQPAVQSVVSSDDMARFEQRFRDELTAMRSTIAAPAPRTDERALMKRVEAIVAESEERQRRELALRTVQVARDLDLQRRADLDVVQRAMGRFQGTIGAENRQLRDGMNILANRVSQTR